MKNPKRIHRIITRLEKLWKKHPELRLSQLIGNLYPKNGLDPYYIEDDDFITNLECWYNLRGLK
jgi:uncharacterized protein YihD (DUF1040 family)